MNTVIARQEIPGIQPCFEVDDALLKNIADALESGQVTNNGPRVRSFERSLAEYLNVEEAVAVSTGSDALLLALKALNLGPGVAILPAYTYIATLNAVVANGLRPIFCDIDGGSFTLDPNHLQHLIETIPGVRCVIPVNVFGVPPQLGSIRQICDSIGARLVYDNAHGFGVVADGLRYAPEADAQIFSFHATKTLPAIEGGLVLASDRNILESVRRLRNHGLAPALHESSPGFNAKMDEIRAIVGAHSLKHFSDALARRQLYGRRFFNQFKRFEDIYRVQTIAAGVSTNFQNIGVCCLPALRIGLPVVMSLFKERGIGVRSCFDPPLNQLRGFQPAVALPVTESVWHTLVSFPIHSRMSEETLSQIEGAIAEVAGILRPGI